MENVKYMLLLFWPNDDFGWIGRCSEQVYGQIV